MKPPVRAWSRLLSSSSSARPSTIIDRVRPMLLIEESKPGALPDAFGAVKEIVRDKCDIDSTRNELLRNRATIGAVAGFYRKVRSLEREPQRVIFLQVLHQMPYLHWLLKRPKLSSLDAARLIAYMPPQRASGGEGTSQSGDIAEKADALASYHELANGSGLSAEDATRLIGTFHATLRGLYNAYPQIEVMGLRRMVRHCYFMAVECGLPWHGDTFLLFRRLYYAAQCTAVARSVGAASSSGKDGLATQQRRVDESGALLEGSPQDFPSIDIEPGTFTFRAVLESDSHGLIMARYLALAIEAMLQHRSKVDVSAMSERQQKAIESIVRLCDHHTRSVAACLENWLSGWAASAAADAAADTRPPPPPAVGSSRALLRYKLQYLSTRHHLGLSEMAAGRMQRECVDLTHRRIVINALSSVLTSLARSADHLVHIVGVAAARQTRSQVRATNKLYARTFVDGERSALCVYGADNFHSRSPFPLNVGSIFEELAEGPSLSPAQQQQQQQQQQQVPAQSGDENDEVLVLQMSQALEKLIRLRKEAIANAAAMGDSSSIVSMAVDPATAPELRNPSRDSEDGGSEAARRRNSSSTSGTAQQPQQQQQQSRRTSDSDGSVDPERQRMSAALGRLRKVKAALQ